MAKKRLKTTKPKAKKAAKKQPAEVVKITPRLHDRYKKEIAPKLKEKFSYANVMLIDPKTNEPTRIGAKILIDDKTGKRKNARVAKVSGEML